MMDQQQSSSTTPTPVSSASSRRLELSLNPVDGSLLTAPLTQVLLAATDSLYSDLHHIVHGELDVTVSSSALVPPTDETHVASSSGGDHEDDDAKPPSAAPVITWTRKRERMSNLSFAQRRHELAWRLARHAQSLTQVAALTAAHATTDLAQAVQASSRALQHARSAWIQADEAQDALFFHHAHLFTARASPHDVYGACDVLLARKWFDLPYDMRLAVDRYDQSPAHQWSKTETQQRWQLAVCRKLLRGEVGWNRRAVLSSDATTKSGVSSSSTLWKVSLCGGLVRLVHGPPKKVTSSVGSSSSSLSDSNQFCYPLEAYLTVFPSSSSASSSSSSSKSSYSVGDHAVDDDPEWRLLSLEVRVRAKTGEFNHQLETSHRQRYDLHRLAALAMAREEAGWRTQLSVSATDDNNSSLDQHHPQKDTLPPARPLQALFQVAHTFYLSWQLEILSAQAQSLRRGVWAAGGNQTMIQVHPVRFFSDSHDSHHHTDPSGSTGGGVLGEMSVLFWKVDDAYGPPRMADLSLDAKPTYNLDESREQNDRSRTAVSSSSSAAATNQLVLSVRAELNVGIIVSLSGGHGIMQSITHQPLLRSTARELLEGASNPLALSMSDVLLAATKLCSEQKCRAVVEALQPSGRLSSLPPWIQLAVDHGSIAVAASVSYYGVEPLHSRKRFPVLFRLTCDGRTGSFVNTISRSMMLLRTLCSSIGDVQASESMTLRLAGLPANRRRAASAHSSGRLAREAFDGLIRSMNLLGQRTGLGGQWDDVDAQSASLRERSIQSAGADVRASIIKCCGMAALYGLLPLAVQAGLGMDALTDVTGVAFESFQGLSDLLKAPPIGVLLSQQTVEVPIKTSDGVSKKSAYISQSYFSAFCGVSDGGVTLFPLEMMVKLDSPTSVPQRQNCKLLQFKAPGDEVIDTGEEPPSKRVRQPDYVMNGNGSVVDVCETIDEVAVLAEILLATLDRELEGDPMPS